MGAELLIADGLRDMTMITADFRNFANATNKLNYCLVGLTSFCIYGRYRGTLCLICLL